MLHAIRVNGVRRCFIDCMISNQANIGHTQRCSASLWQWDSFVSPVGSSISTDTHYIKHSRLIENRIRSMQFLVAVIFISTFYTCRSS